MIACHLGNIAFRTGRRVQWDVAKEMVALWKGTHPALPFRFGYYDNHDHPHLLYTHKPAAK